MITMMKCSALEYAKAVTATQNWINGKVIARRFYELVSGPEIIAREERRNALGHRLSKATVSWRIIGRLREGEESQQWALSAQYQDALPPLGTFEQDEKELPPDFVPPMSSEGWIPPDVFALTMFHSLQKILASVPYTGRLCMPADPLAWKSVVVYPKIDHSGEIDIAKVTYVS